ncbi:MAG: M28 family peptidase [Crocinitomicaceae bacterium]
MSALFSASAKEADSTLVSAHLDSIVLNYPNRNYQNISSLNGCAAYVHKIFERYGDSTHYQAYEVKGSTYKNVITSFGPRSGERLVIGAHYDVCGNQDGADDNASGVVGLLELARLLKDVSLKKRIDLVAYTLEEPPFFRSRQMGSYVHAQYLSDNNIPVYGMICLEMIGYFSDQKKSQAYPLKLLRLFYGNKGDFITVVKKICGGKMPRKFKRKFKKNELLKTKSFSAPAKLTGIDFSDHLNYWAFDYPAVMVTNSGFYRNPHYHKSSDQIHTLNLSKMTQVIQQIYLTLIESCSVSKQS